MEALGIIRTNSLELVDIEIRDGAILTESCPAEFVRACNDCGYLARMELQHDIEVPLPADLDAAKRQNVAFLICCWHERNGEAAQPV